MVFGIGTDILDRGRLDRGLDAAFIKSVYTDAEIAQAEARREPRAYYATRFAAKEAVLKAVSVCLSDFRPREIETLSDENGRPSACLHGKTADEVNAYLNGRTYQLLVSMSCEDKTAIAYCVAQTLE